MSFGGKKCPSNLSLLISSWKGTSSSKEEIFSSGVPKYNFGTPPCSQIRLISPQVDDFAEGGFWKEAELDLKEAIRQREKDQQWARTYARNFISYFPHRELGIIYYKQGRYEEAVNELNISLSTLHSPRAESYLLLAEKSSRQK